MVNTTHSRFVFNTAAEAQAGDLHCLSSLLLLFIDFLNMVSEAAASHCNIVLATSNKEFVMESSTVIKTE